MRMISGSRMTADNRKPQTVERARETKAAVRNGHISCAVIPLVKRQSEFVLST
jgi:hypothetical protein